MPRTACSHRRSPSARAPCRAATAALLLAVTACAGASPGETAPATGVAAATAAARAGAAVDALLDRFWDAGASDFAHVHPSSGERAGYWISANALDVLVHAAARTGSRRYLDAAHAFVRAQEQRGFTRDWFDDEAWMALALLRLHDLDGDPANLARATALLQDIGWNAPDGSCCGASPGGLWWDRSRSQKATASNAIPALVAARLYQRTGDAGWLDFARGVYGWWRDHMVDGSGQVADHLLPTGEQVWWRFSYDQGAMIGAALALRDATGDDRYLADARRFAAPLLGAMTRSTPYGAVLFDGASCSGDCDQFKGIAHRHLAELFAADPGVPGLAALLGADGEAAWAIARDPGSGTFGVDWGGGAGSSTSLAAQASAAMALEAEAGRARGATPGASAAR